MSKAAGSGASAVDEHDAYYIDSDDELMHVQPCSEPYVVHLIRHLVIHKADSAAAGTDLGTIDVTPDRFYTGLGLILEDFADRVTKSRIIKAAYNRVKQTKFTLTAVEHLSTQDMIAGFIDHCVSAHGEVFRDPAQVKVLPSSEKLKILHYIFNPSITCDYINTDGTSDTPRRILREELHSYRAAGKFSVRFLQKELSHLTLALDKESQPFQAYSMASHRRDKNALKIAITDERDFSVSTSLSTISRCYTDECVTSEIASQLHSASGKLQSQILHLGKYNAIFDPLYEANNKLNELGKCVITGLKYFIKEKTLPVITGEYPESITKIEHIILDLANLMFILEPIRNKTAFITSPMFLETLLFSAENNNIPSIDVVESYPMALDGATDGSRTIRKIYRETLPDKIYMDYAVGDSSAVMKKLLIKEGKLLIAYLNTNNMALAQRMAIIECAQKLNDALESKLTALQCQEIQIDLENLRDNAAVDESLTESLAAVCSALPAISTIATSTQRQSARRKVETIDEGDAERFKTVITESSIIEKLEAAAQTDMEYELREALYQCTELLHDWYGMDTSELIELLGRYDGHAAGFADHK